MLNILQVMQLTFEKQLFWKLIFMSGNHNLQV